MGSDSEGAVCTLEHHHVWVVSNDWKTVIATQISAQEWRIDAWWRTIMGEQRSSSKVVTTSEAWSLYAWYRAEGYTIARMARRMPFEEVMAKGRLIIDAANELDAELFTRLRHDSAAFLPKHYDLMAGQDQLIDAFLAFAGWTSEELHAEDALRRSITTDVDN